jgi:hypothetical protein
MTGVLPNQAAVREQKLNSDSYEIGAAFQGVLL